MAEQSFPVLGFDIGGTKIAVCIATSDGRILASERIPSGAGRPYAEALPEAVSTARRLADRAGLRVQDIRGCGICAPGPLDTANGLLLKSPNMSWDRAPVRDDLQRELGMPAFLHNDANGGVLAECRFGTGKGRGNVVYLTMSTGVGSGIMVDGHLVQGATGVGGEMGHMVLDLDGPRCGCGMHGCLEAYCGGRNVALRLRELLRDKPDHAMMRLPEVDGDSARLAYPALRAGVQAEIPLAMELWDEICMRLAQGIGVCLMTFNPEIVVLGTLAYYSGDMLLDPVRGYLPRFAWREMLSVCRVEASVLGPKVGELAGIAVALYELQRAR